MRERVAEAFRETFEMEPAVVVGVPGRVTLLGGTGTVPHEPTLTGAIDRGLWLAAAPSRDRTLHVTALDIHTREMVDLDEPGDLQRPWLAYPLGVARSLRASGHSVPGLTVAIGGNLPAGAGLGSSVALTLAFAVAWNQLAYLGLDTAVLTTLAQSVEAHTVEWAAPAVMMQSVPGQLSWFDGVRPAPTPVGWPDGAVLFLADSGVRRVRADASAMLAERAAESASALRRLQQLLPGIGSLRDVDASTFDRVHTRLPEPERRRARHLIGEAMRVERGVAALRSGDWRGFGFKLQQSTMSLRHNFDATIPQLDLLFETAVGVPGCYGACCAADGLGGFLLVVAKEKAVGRIQTAMTSAYAGRYGRGPRFLPVTLRGGTAVEGL